MVKKIITGIIDFVSIVLIVFAVGILITVVLTKKGESPSFMGHSAFRVLTGSMEPTIPVDSMVVTKEVQPDEIAVGDIITFYSADPELDGSVVTHRVAGVSSENGDTWYTTKGDANVVVDEYPVSFASVIGKMVFTSVIMGKAVRLAANPLIFILFIAIPLVAILVINMVQTVKTAKEIEQEEILEALADRKKPEADPASAGPASAGPAPAGPAFASHTGPGIDSENPEIDKELLRAEIDRIKAELRAQQGEQTPSDTDNNTDNT